MPATTATTNAAGVASTSVVFPAPSTAPAAAIFYGANDGYTEPERHAAARLRVRRRHGDGDERRDPALAPERAEQRVRLGGTLTASTTLTNASNGVPISGATVVFTLGGASSDELGATTNSLGVATVAFTPSARGMHTVSAWFPGFSSSDAAQSTTSTVAVYQRTR